MIEEVEIQETEQQQPDPPKKKLWKSLADKQLYTKSYEDFEQQFNAPEKINKLYKTLSEKQLYTKSEQDFNNQFFTTTTQKKKDYNSPTQSNGVVGGEIPTIQIDENAPVEQQYDPIEASKRAFELSQKTKEVSVPSSGKGGQNINVVPDEESLNISRDIKKKFKDEQGIDLDELYSEIKDVSPDILFSHRQELLKDRKDNPQLYSRKLARLSWQPELDNSLKKLVGSGYLNEDDYHEIVGNMQASLDGQSHGNYTNQREAVQSVANAIRQFGGENKDAILKNYATEVAKVYGNPDNKVETKESDTPESKYLTNDNAKLGYEYLKDISPDKAEQYTRLFIDPKSLKDKPDEKRGYDHLMLKLEETGLNLKASAIEEELNNLNVIARDNNGLTPEQLNRATELEKKKDELVKQSNELETKYPEKLQDKIADAVTEVLGNDMNWGEYALAKTGQAGMNTVKGVWEAVSSPFMSDASNNMRELALMGETLDDQQLFKQPDKNKSLLTDRFIMKPELQTQVDAIKNNSVLSREQKKEQLQRLFFNNQDKFGRVPTKGAEFNISPSSILYGVTDIGTTLLPFIGLEALTGGGATAGAARKFLSTFTAAATTSFHDEYANALLEGKPKSEAYKYALASTGISSLGMAGAGTAEKVRAMLRGNQSSLASIVSKMTDSEIEKMLAKTPKALTKIADRIKATPNMIKQGLKTGAEFEVAMNAANEVKHQTLGTPIDREQNFKQSVLGVINFGILGAGLGHIGYKSPTELQKSSFLETGKNPTEYIEQARQMQKDGNLTAEQFEQVKSNIENSAAAYKNLPTKNSKGQDLSEKEKGDYLYNEAVKQQAKKGELPPKQKEKADFIAAVADAKNDLILDTPKDLEKRKEQIEKAIEATDENGKPKLNDKELLSAKAEVEAIDQTIKERQDTTKGEPDNISKPIELKVEPSIESFAERIAKGEKLDKPEDLQFYENNKKEIEQYLSDKSTKETGTTEEVIGEDVLPEQKENAYYKQYKPFLEGTTEQRNEALKDISEQWHDPRSRKLLEDSIPPEIIKEAKEKFPKEESTLSIEDPPIEPPKEEGGEGAFVEDKRTQLSFRGLQEVATEFGLNDVTSRERKSDLQLFKDAETEVGKWVVDGTYSKNIEALTQKMNDRKPVSDTERVIMEGHIHNQRIKANEVAKEFGVNSPEFKEAVNEIDKITKAAITSRQEAGAALRIPTIANNNAASLADAIIATKEAKGVGELTEKETAEVENQYQAVKDTQAKFEEYKAEAEAKFKEYQAEIEMLKLKGESKPKKPTTSADFKTQRENIKKAIAEKWKEAGKSDVAYSTVVPLPITKAKQLAAISKDVALLMRNYYGDGVRTLNEMVDKIHEYLKDAGLPVEKNDVQDLIAGKYNEKKLTRNEMSAKIRELQTEQKLLNEYERLLSGGEPLTEKGKQKRNKRLEQLRKEIKGIEEIDKEIQKTKDASLKNKESETKSREKEFSKVEKEDKLKQEREFKQKQIEAERERKKQIAEAERKRKELERELQKEIKDEEKARLKEAIKEAKELERQLSYRTPIQKAVGDAIARNEKKAERFKEKIANGEFEKQPKPKTVYEAKEWQKKNPSLYKKLLDSQTKANEAEAEFHSKLIEHEMKNWGLGEKARNIAKKSSGTLKQLFASFDLSAIAVQNLPFILTHPVTGLKGVAKSGLHLLSQKEFDRLITELHNSPDWNLIKDSGLRVTEPKSLLEATREEYFPDRFKAVVKINGKEYGWVKIGGNRYELLDLSKPFERQFTALGNLLRVVQFRTEVEKLNSKGITWENKPEEFKTLAKRLNNLSSSSDIPDAFQNDVTRTLIWSSRLIAAKLNMLGISDVAAMLPGTGVKKGYYKGLGIKGQLLSRQQKYAIYDLAKFATSVTALTYLTALAKGGTVNTTPTSNGFMDVEYDDGKSMNLTGGFSSYIAKLFQFANRGKTDRYGVFRKYGGLTDPVKETATFLASKAPPVTRTVENLIAGKDQFGQEADISSEASKYKMPLAMGQIYDQIQKDGVGALFTEGIPTLIGFNAKDNRNYNVHNFDKETEKFIVDKAIQINMPKKVYKKFGEKVTMSEDEYKDFLKQVDVATDKAVADLKKEGSYVIRNKTIEKVPYSSITKEEIQDIIKDKISEATEKIRKEKFKTDEYSEDYEIKKGLEQTLREMRAENN